MPLEQNVQKYHKLSFMPSSSKKGPAFYPSLVKQLTRPVSAITGRAFVSCTGTAQAALLPLYPKEAFGTLKTRTTNYTRGKSVQSVRFHLSTNWN